MKERLQPNAPLDKYLASMKARSAAATPGPWFQSIATIVGAESLFVAELISDQHRDKRVSQINADGRFIAASRTDVDRLVAMVEAAREALAYYAPVENWLSKHGAYTDENSESGTRARRALAELDRIAASGGENDSD